MGATTVAELERAAFDAPQRDVLSCARCGATWANQQAFLREERAGRREWRCVDCATRPARSQRP